MWVLAGADGNNNLSDVWSSSNGSDWVNATINADFGGRYQIKVVEYNCHMWILGGYDGTDSLKTV